MADYKIAIITPTFPPKGGGIATAHYNLYLLLKDIYEVRVFAYDDVTEEEGSFVIKKKTPTWIIPIISFFYRLYVRKFNQRTDFVNFRRILNCSIGVLLINRPIKQFSPDIIIVPDNNIPLYWIKKRSAKVIWVSHNNYLRFRDNSLISNYSHVDIDISRSMENRAIKKTDLVLSPSNYMISEYEKAYNYKPEIVVINNFLMRESIIESISSMPRNRFDKNRNIVFIPSGGSINKGCRYTYEIIRRIGKELNYEVDFCISGPVENELLYELEYVDKRTKLYTPGAVCWEENVSYLASCQLVVSPTLIENYSSAFIEAFVLGKAIVTFDVGGNAEIIDSGKNGFCVPYLNVDELVNKSVLLLTDKNKLKDFSNNAQKKASEICDLERIEAMYYKVFNSLMNEE